MALPKVILMWNVVLPCILILLLPGTPALRLGMLGILIGLFTSIALMMWKSGYWRSVEFASGKDGFATSTTGRAVSIALVGMVTLALAGVTVVVARHPELRAFTSFLIGSIVYTSGLLAAIASRVFVRGPRVGGRQSESSKGL